jgi:hypothetical protein
MNDEHRFQNIRDAHNYCFAGKSTITLKSRKTENHFSYRVSVAKDNDKLFFVSRPGERNSCFGVVGEKGFFLTKRAKAEGITLDTLFVKAFVWFLKLKELPYDLQAQHQHTCGRCGRQLTHPESIDLGIGPECKKHINPAKEPVIIELMHEISGYDE